MECLNYVPSRKTANVLEKMKRLDIDKPACTEVRWPDTGECQVDNFRTYYTLNQEIVNSVKAFAPVSNRASLLKTDSQPYPLNLISSICTDSKK